MILLIFNACNAHALLSACPCLLFSTFMMENVCFRGTGFISCPSPDEARKAIMVNGRLLGSRPAYVSQSKGCSGW